MKKIFVLSMVVAALFATAASAAVVDPMATFGAKTTSPGTVPTCPPPMVLDPVTLTCKSTSDPGCVAPAGRVNGLCVINPPIPPCYSPNVTCMEGKKKGQCVSVSVCQQAAHGIDDGGSCQTTKKTIACGNGGTQTKTCTVCTGQSETCTTSACVVPTNCQDGYVKNDAGICVPKGPTCPTGQTYNQSLGKCVPISCPTGYYLNDLGVCVLKPNDCPVGQVYNASLKKCVPISCPTGYYLNEFGVCVLKPNDCPVGRVYNAATGKCESSKQIQGVFRR